MLTRMDKLLYMGLILLAVSMAGIVIGAVYLEQAASRIVPPIERNQWGQEKLTERELCEATILQWDEERCALLRF